jgi:hypothetical protein
VTSVEAAQVYWRYSPALWLLFLPMIENHFAIFLLLSRPHLNHISVLQVQQPWLSDWGYQQQRPYRGRQWYRYL